MCSLANNLHVNVFKILPFLVTKTNVKPIIGNETDCKQQIRLRKVNESIKRKRSEETDSAKQNRLEKDRLSKRQKKSVETDLEWQARLEKDSLNNKSGQQYGHNVNRE